jgi:membrane associated rhomboid family serine protease
MLLITTYINREFIIENLGLWPIFILKKPWTVVTSMFLHASFWHLFGNMLTLFFFGSYLSRLVGSSKFLIVYFGGGIFGSILFILLAPPLSVAIGASGAVYAVAGALVMMRPNLRVLLYFIVPMPLWVVITVFFVVFSFIPGVAWQAHLGGLIVGLPVGYFFRRRERYQG